MNKHIDNDDLQNAENGCCGHCKEHNDEHKCCGGHGHNKEDGCCCKDKHNSSDIDNDKSCGCGCSSSSECDDDCECGCKDKSEISEVDKLLAENKKLHNDLLLVVADMQNLKKRTEQDLKNGRDYIISSMVKKFLPVADNLKRALNAYELNKNDIAPLVEGIKMVSDEFMKSLAEFGVIPIKAIGEKFDPNVHQAISNVPCKNDKDDGFIADEIQTGYTMNGKVIKESLVAVYKKS